MTTRRATESCVLMYLLGRRRFEESLICVCDDRRWMEMVVWINAPPESVMDTAYKMSARGIDASDEQRLHRGSHK